MSGYPEHDKMAKVRDEADEIGQFLEWLESEKLTVCGFSDEVGRWVPGWSATGWRGGIEQLLARYFDIDLAKLDDEKRDMLRRLRASQN